MRPFDLFLAKYPPGGGLRKPAAGTLDRFRDRLPAELLALWREHGFGNYGDGLIKVIDPADYADTLTLWLGEQPGCYPILMTGFGSLVICRRTPEGADDICLLDIHRRRSGSLGAGFFEFFEQILPSDAFAGRFLWSELYREAVRWYGIPAEREIFFLSPVLPSGGAGSPKFMEKGDALASLRLLFEAGAGPSAEADAAWQRAYEAEPQAFELEEGGLMAGFTLTETVDTILPVAPEAQYEIEGESISLWALTFFSLTRDEVLGTLEYHRALRRLQPYLTDAREGSLLIRGLTLEEMERVLTEA